MYTTLAKYNHRWSIINIPEGSLRFPTGTGQDRTPSIYVQNSFQVRYTSTLMSGNAAIRLRPSIYGIIFIRYHIM